MGAEKIKFDDFHEAGLNFYELEQLARDIHNVVLRGRGVGLQEYIAIAKKVKATDLGVRKVNALKYEPKLNMYFPDEVLKILKTKADGRSFHRFNDDDDRYLLEHQSMGPVSLAKRFYVDHRTILKRAERLGVKLPSYFHQYTASEDKMILDNIDKGPSWLSKELDLGVNSVRNRIRNLKHPGEKFNKHSYTTEDEDFIKVNLSCGYKKLAEHFGASISSVRGKVKRMRDQSMLIE